QPITDAVITVPAYFNDAERTATITAGQLAGFNVLQIINEPTAAALAYGLDKLNEDQTVFVFDLGGGTFDVTIMRIQGQHINMIATNGDHRLGGKDWDDIIVNHMAEEFDRRHGENPLPAPGREVQNHMRNGDAGSEHDVGRYRQDSTGRRHDSYADGADAGFATD